MIMDFRLVGKFHLFETLIDDRVLYRSFIANIQDNTLLCNSQQLRPFQNPTIMEPSLSPATCLRTLQYCIEPGNL